MSKHEERVAYLRRVAHKMDYYPDREDVRTLLKALDKAEGEVKELERECAGLHADLACRRPAEPTEAREANRVRWTDKNRWERD